MENNIVYFDGVCNLCNALLHFLMKYDSDKNLLFSWSKSDYAILTLPKNVLEYTDTSIIFYRNGNFYKKSEVPNLRKMTEKEYVNFVRGLNTLPSEKV